MNKKTMNSKSKFLSLILRHNPQAGNLTLDNEGYAFVSDVVKALEITENDLNDIVCTDEKKRYSYNKYKNKIRANQGHSIDVDIKFKEKKPPNILYHGTGYKSIDSILKKGIMKMLRNYVHISSDYDTAINVGKRHKDPVVFKVDAISMYNDGIKFFLSDNDVWLTDFIDPKYISLI